MNWNLRSFFRRLFKSRKMSFHINPMEIDNGEGCWIPIRPEKVCLKRTVITAGVPSSVNGFIYPKEILKREIDKNQNLINERRMLGCPFPSVGISVPRQQNINLMDVSHLVTKMSMVEDNLNVEIEVLSTPNGKVLKELIQNDCSVRFGLSGVGSINDKTVQDDYILQSIDFDVILESIIEEQKEKGEST